jgi:chaperonin GroEL
MSHKQLLFRSEVEGEALATLVVNKLQGTLRCAAVKAPGYGDRRKETLQDIAILTGGQVVTEELGLKFEKEAIEDAISATKAAVAEGIVPGGGLTLLRAIKAVEAEEAQCQGDERTGVQILKRALEAPTRQIAENSAVDGGMVVGRMAEGTGSLGFDAARKQYVDLVEAGIVDPTRVVRVALENAVSAASVPLLTEATLTEHKDEKEERTVAVEQVVGPTAPSCAIGTRRA